MDHGVVPDNKEFIVTTMHGLSSEYIRNFYKEDLFDVVLSMAQQMVKALQKLHSIGYVHGDIKPENILFHCSD